MLRFLTLALVAISSLSAHAALAPKRVDAYCPMDLGGRSADLAVMTYDHVVEGQLVERTSVVISDHLESHFRYEVSRVADDVIRFEGTGFTLTISRAGDVDANGMRSAHLAMSMPNGLTLDRALRCRAE